jgi:predicted ATPase
MRRVDEDRYSYEYIVAEDYVKVPPPPTFPPRYSGEKAAEEEPPQFLSSPQSCYALPHEVSKIDSSFLRFNFHFEAFIERITYLGPLREHPKRTYLWSGSAPRLIGKSGEQAIDALIAAERRGRPSDHPSLVSDVSNWLERLGLASNLTVDTINKEKGFYEPRVRITEHSEPVNIADAGFGVSQVLPVIVQLFLVPEYSIVLLEQPEIHLHPSAQSELADLFLEVTEKRHLQLIIETHSEYLLTRLQRRIAEATAEFASPENIQLYFIELTDDGSQATEVRANEFGEIENWPEGFFGDRIGDLDAMTRAGLERRLADLQDQPDE